MADFWGPALDAELAYRHERLFTALRAIPAAETPETDARSDSSPQPAHHPLVSAARGWLLRGSETWHAAR
jgi:hypothetical protein